MPMKRSKTTTLSQVISDDEEFLEGYDVEVLVNIFGHRCRHTTKTRLRKILRQTNEMTDSAIYEHVHYDPEDGWSHAAGPDLLESRKRIREKILLNRTDELVRGKKL